MKKRTKKKQQSKRTRRKRVSTAKNMLQKRIRDPARFVKFRVVSRISRLSASDQKKVRSTVAKSKRPGALYTVGKFKKSASKRNRPRGKTGKPLAWGLQKVQVPKKKGHGVRKT